MDRFLSDRQRRTVAAALTLVSGLLMLFAAGKLLVLLGHFATTFSNVLMPLAVAGILTLILKPYFNLLVGRLSMKPPLAVAVVFISLLIPVVAFLWFFGALLVEQIGQLVDEMPGWYVHLRTWFSEHLPALQALADRIELKERISTAWGEQGGNVLLAVQNLLTEVLHKGVGVFRYAAGLLGWFVVPVYMFFFLQAKSVKREQLEDLFPFLKQETRRDLVYLAEQFVQIMVAFFRGQIVIALLQGLLFAIGFSLCGLKYGFVLGLLLGFLNIIPYLGNIVGLAIAIPLALFQPEGGVTLLAMIMGVFVLVQVIEGYVLTPRIMGEQTGLHPLAIMIAIFFWGTALGGLAGMMLAIPLTAFLVIFWRLARERYIKEIV